MVCPHPHLTTRSRWLTRALIPIWALFVGTAAAPVETFPSLQACKAEAAWYLAVKKQKRVACLSGKTVLHIDPNGLPANLRKGRK